MGINDHRAVMTGVDQVGVVAVPFHGPNHALKLPGSGGAARVEEVPRDIDL